MTGILDNCGISPGHFTKLFCEQKDKNRVANRNSTGKVKLIRKKLLARRNGYADKHLETEGVTYGAEILSSSTTLAPIQRHQEAPPCTFVSANFLL